MDKNVWWTTKIEFSFQENDSNSTMSNFEHKKSTKIFIYYGLYSHEPK